MCDRLPHHIPGYCPPERHPDLGDPETYARIDLLVRKMAREEEERRLRDAEEIPSSWMAL